MSTKAMWAWVVVVVIVLAGIIWYAKMHSQSAVDTSASLTPSAADTGAVPTPADTSEPQQATTTSSASSTGATAGVSASASAGVTGHTQVPAPTAVPATKTFTVTGQNFSFAPATISVNKGDKVTINFKNAGGTHNLTVEGYNVATPTVADGQTSSITFTADKAGSFAYYCSVGNHRAMGMQGTITVK